MANSPNSYKDAFWTDLATSAENKAGLPKGLLVSIVNNGERTNNDRVSSAGAKTVFQIIPDTAKAAEKKYGIDPYLSPENAAEVAGLLLKDSLDRNKGNVLQAIAEYHGGTDRANWGPVTKAYVSRVSQGMRQSSAPAVAASAAPVGSTFDRVMAAQGKPNTGSIANVFNAYKSGQMSPEDAAEFEADVNAGNIMLPKGATLNTAEKQQSADGPQLLPQAVADAYVNGKMSPEDKAELENDMRSGLVSLPAAGGALIPTGNGPVPTTMPVPSAPAADPGIVQQALGFGANLGKGVTSLVDNTVGAVLPFAAQQVAYAGARAVGKSPEVAQAGASNIAEAISQPMGKAFGVTQDPAYQNEASSQIMKFIGENIDKGADWLANQTGLPKNDVVNMIGTASVAAPGAVAKVAKPVAAAVADSPIANAARVATGEVKQATRPVIELAREKIAPSVGKEAGERLQKRIAEDKTGVVEEYNKLPESNGGQIINTDIARELSPAYRNDRSRSADVHEAASDFAKQVYAEKLAEATPAGKEPTVLFTGGGTGAGKSTGLELLGETAKNAEIIYDTNMNSLDSSVKKIEQALDANREVEIAYTYRDPVEALALGALPRAMRMGRTVPIESHADTHIGARKVIEQLEEKYKDDPRVKISIIDNSKGKGKAEVTTLDKIPQISENGLKEKLNATVEEQYASGKISENVRNGTIGVQSDAGGTLGKDSKGTGKQLEQTGSGAETGNNLKTLPESVKTDIADAILVKDAYTKETPYMDAWEKAGKNIDDFDTKGILQVLEKADDINLNIETVNPNLIKNEGRAVSRLVVEEYKKMLNDSEPPAIVVKRDSKGNLEIVEGGHRLQAAKEANAESIKVVDITNILNKNPNLLFSEAKKPTAGTKNSVGSAGTDKATQRRIQAQDLPKPIDLTKGQAERTLEQVRFERETAKDPSNGQKLRERYEDQNAKIAQNFDAYIDATGAQIGEGDLRGAGIAVDKAIRDAAARDKIEIRVAYKNAEKAGEMAQPITLQNVVDHLNESSAETVTSPLLTTAKNVAIKLGIATEKDGLLNANAVTLKDAETFRQAINRNVNAEPSNIRQAIILKNAVDNATENAGGDIYKSARALRRRFAENYENHAAIADIIRNKRGTEDRAIALEKVVDRTIVDPARTLDDVRQVRRVLQRSGEQGAQAWRELQGKTLEHIKNQAYANSAKNSRGETVISFAGLNKVVNLLDKQGKLDFVFGKLGAEKIRLLRDIAGDIATDPPGAVNHSNTASTLLAALDGGIIASTGIPVPIATGLRLVAKNIKDRKLKARIEEALDTKF